MKKTKYHCNNCNYTAVSQSTIFVCENTNFYGTLMSSLVKETSRKTDKLKLNRSKAAKLGEWIFHVQHTQFILIGTVRF